MQEISPMTTDELTALRKKRDEAIKNWRRWECSVEELLRAYAAGERDFRGANLESANLEHANLERAYLYNANLEHANLERANLSLANLESAYLYNANLESANLESAYLYNANLEHANLERANLERAYLYNANLESANLESAYLSRANLERAYLSRANLINAPGLYSAFAPHLSSRRAPLVAMLVISDGAIALRFNAGCFKDKIGDELRARVKYDHGDNGHAVQYEAAISFIEACFAQDMADGRWDYLIALNQPKETVEA